jgi:hypothetical protein
VWLRSRSAWWLSCPVVDPPQEVRRRAYEGAAGSCKPEVVGGAVVGAFAGCGHEDGAAPAGKMKWLASW